MRLIPLLLSLSLLQACDFQQALEKLVSDEKLSTAKKQIEFMLTSDFSEVEKIVTPDIKKELSQETLNQIRSAVPKEDPISIELVGAHFRTSQTRSTKIVTESYSFQYQYPDKWILVTLNILTENDQEPLIGGFNTTTLKDDLREINKFTFEDKPIQNYIIFLATLGVPVFIIISLIMCYKTPIPKRKWLWYIFIVFGICEFQLEWTTGQWGIHLLFFQLLGSSFSKLSEFAPVIIETSIPLGAVLFQIKRKKW